MKRFLTALVVAGLGLAFTGSAQAFTQSATGTMSIGATLAASCTVATAPMDFGSYDGSAFLFNGTSTITVNCSSTTPYRVDIDVGLNDWSNTNGGLRYLKTGALAPGATNTILYKLYKSSSYFEQWGDNGATFCTNCTPAITGVSGTGTGADQVLTVYGWLDRTHNSPGAYTDTVTVTVNY